MPLSSLDPSRLLNIGGAFSASRVLLSAIELDLFTVLQTPHTAEQLRVALKVHHRCIPDFPDTLVALGVLGREGEGASALYSNAPDASAFLVKTSPTYIGGILEYCATTLYHSWGHLTEALQSVEPQPQHQGPQQHGVGVDGIWENHEQSVELFMTAMVGLNSAAHGEFAQRFNFEKCKTLLDLGGGSAQLCCEVARRNEHMTCTNLELPLVEKFALENVRRQGLQDRVGIRTGDMFEDALGAADVIVMSNVLHAFGGERKKVLLRRAFDALEGGGRVVVIEMLIDDERRSGLHALIVSLNMLVETHDGYNFSARDCDEICKEVGFVRTEKIELAPPFGGIVAYKE